MTAILVSVAEEVKTELETALAAGYFTTRTFTPERSLPEWDDILSDEDLKLLKVDVVPVFNPDVDIFTKTAIVYSPEVDIVVRKKFGPSELDNSTGRISQEETDALIELVEQINTRMCLRILADNSWWSASRISAAYVKKHLREHKQFTGIVRVTFNARANV